MSELFIKVETNWITGPLATEIGHAGVGLFLTMRAESMRLLTDGFLTDRQLARMGADDDTLAILEDVGLIGRSSKPLANGLANAKQTPSKRLAEGWQIAGWEDDNKTAAEVDEIREKRRIAGAKGGRKKAANSTPGKQTASKPLANAKQTPSKPLANAYPEYRVQSTEKTLLQPTVTQAGDSPDPGRSPGDPPTAIAKESLAAFGFAADPPEPTEGDLRNISRAMTLGWTEAKIVDLAAQAAERGDVARPGRWLSSTWEALAKKRPTDESDPREIPIAERLAAAKAKEAVHA